MVTAEYTNYYGHKNTVKVDHLVNRGEWFGKTWLIEIGGFGFWSMFFVVESDREQDAIDVFTDSKFGHLIKVEDSDDYCEACQVEDYDNCQCNFAGNAGDRVNLDYVAINRCKVNYFAKKEDS